MSDKSFDVHQLMSGNWVVKILSSGTWYLVGYYGSKREAFDALAIVKPAR